MKKTNPQAFDNIYNNLNPAQRAAVDQIEGPIMVLAGPGTGKTHVLAARIANILQKTDTPPHAVLALTFTESAAANIRERVVSMIGPTGYYVNIATFHAFCQEVIQSYPEHFPIDRGSEALSQLSRYSLFEQLIHGLNLKTLKPINRPFFYINDIMRAISELKREGVSPEELIRITDDEYQTPTGAKITKIEEARMAKNREKNRELAEIYREYEKQLRKRLRYDFDDMISLTVTAFENNPLLLREYQEKLQYFLVDEYQDTNSSQNRVVQLLASYWGEAANVFVVGDPHQAIYRFQGASIENVAEFAKNYPKAPVITLDTSFRSMQTILDGAAAVIKNNTLTTIGYESKQVEKKLEQAFSKKLHHFQNKVGSPITIIKSPSQTLEMVFIARSIATLLQKKVLPHEIAVLYRHNADAALIQETLEKWGVAYALDGGVNVLETENIGQLLTLLEAISAMANGDDPDSLFELMCFEWTPPLGMMAMKIAQAAGKARVSVLEMIEKGYREFKKYHQGDGVEEEDFKSATLYLQKIMQWGVENNQIVFTQWFEKIIKESGFLDWIMAGNARLESLTNLNSLFREVKALNQENHNMRISDFMEAIGTMREHNISIYSEDLNVEKGAVHLSTAHRAKGREWKHVFIMHCIDGKWGNNRAHDLIPLPKNLLVNTDLSKKEKNEDERRLFYVSLTRAIDQVYITYPATIIDSYRSRIVIPSMFIEEIGEKFKKFEEPQITETEAKEDLVTLISPAYKQIKVSDEEYFRDLVADFKLSVTALNTYLKDREEFVRNVLLRAPRAKEEHMGFGTAIHEALEAMYLDKIKGQKPNVKTVMNKFDEAIKKELIHSNNLKRRIEQGHIALKAYFDEFNAEPVETLYVERFFGSGFAKTVLGDIPLTGRIDRVDWVDRLAKTVRVIDYKTGKARTQGDIEGKTVAAQLSKREQELPESIRGAYKRQLLFYKLLTDLDRSFIPTAVEGIFDFVEPEERTGKPVRRSIEFVKSDVDDLKDLIRQVMKEIRNLEFLEKV